jgi:ABC-type transport system involved in multi-copper enzyme maturation permease subunit
MVVLLVLWGITYLVRRPAGEQVPLVLSESVLLPLTVIAGLVCLFALGGWFLVYRPAEMMESLVRLPQAGQRQIVETFEPGTTLAPIRVDLRGLEAVELKMDSDELVEIVVAETPEDQFVPPAEVGPTQQFDWERRTQAESLFGGNYVENLYVTNLSERPATVTIDWTVGPAYPEVRAIPITALSVIGLYLIYFVQAWCFPRASAIALATTKSEMAQPLFWILMALGLFLLLLFLFLPYNTFGEDIKMLKDSGLTLIMIMGIIQGVWAASNSVSEEIEGRTALTVLSKPVGRRQFILGKLSGILWTVALLFIVLGIMLLLVVAYKPVFDAREMGSENPEWTISHLEVMLTVPGLVLAFFEAVVLVSLSVAISTRLPMLANFVICFAIYVLGHITPLIVQSPIQFAPVVFIGKFIATILPVLDHFNIQAAVAAGRPVPLLYLGWSLLYCILYSGIAILLALALFEDRDLA